MDVESRWLFCCNCDPPREWPENSMRAGSVLHLTLDPHYLAMTSTYKCSTCTKWVRGVNVDWFYKRIVEMLFEGHWISKPLDKEQPGPGAEEIQEISLLTIQSLQSTRAGLRHSFSQLGHAHPSSPCLLSLISLLISIWHSWPFHSFTSLPRHYSLDFLFTLLMIPFILFILALSLIHNI